MPHRVVAAGRGDAALNLLARIIPPLVILILGLAAWEIAVRVAKLPVYILPGPVVIVQALVRDWATLYPSLVVTLLITLGALTAATGCSAF